MRYEKGIKISYFCVNYFNRLHLPFFVIYLTL